MFAGELVLSDGDLTRSAVLACSAEHEPSDSQPLAVFLCGFIMSANIGSIKKLLALSRVFDI